MLSMQAMHHSMPSMQSTTSHHDMHSMRPHHQPPDSRCVGSTAAVGSTTLPTCPHTATHRWRRLRAKGAPHQAAGMLPLTDVSSNALQGRQGAAGGGVAGRVHGACAEVSSCWWS